MEKLRKFPKVTESTRRRCFYAFGSYRLDPVKRLLLQGSELLALAPKDFDLLLALVAQHGQVLVKEELMQEVWPDTVVEEGNLNRHISTLRRVLGESRDQHEYIVTVPGRGYRFVAAVTEESEDEAPTPNMGRREADHLSAMDGVFSRGAALQAPFADDQPLDAGIISSLAKIGGGAEDLPRESQRKRYGGLEIMGAIAALCAALSIVAYFSLRPLKVHGEPKFGRLDGSTLMILNADGKELWGKVFPEGFANDWLFKKDIGARLWFGDLEGTGHTSVLFVYAPANPQSRSSTLICYSDRGQEKWRWTPGRELPELAGSPATFRTAALGVLKATGTRPPRIVVSSIHDLWWPSQIARIDANGKTISEYWHSGALSYMMVADLDGDGREEIVATGVSNGNGHQATLVVLDPDRVLGASSETQPEFQIHGMGVAQERLRLLFPRSDLNEALFQFNWATEPRVEGGSIRVTVVECIAPPGCQIWYEFDKKFSLIAAYAGGDEFRSAHARFYQTGKDAHPLNADEQAAFQRVRCLVGCKSEFVPVGNLVP
jgi:DNA-binding winged helix-turn-helix (wHTH) protein